MIIIAGPCVIENEDLTIDIARTLKTISIQTKIPIIFKASYDKANRSLLKSYRGVGIDEGLKILREVRAETGLSVTSDVHETKDVEKAAKILDVIQIPAFLCRQTDLLLAAADTKLLINIKKGQFLSPKDVEFIIEKIKSRGNDSIYITERGTTFGYRNLVVDMRSIPIMKDFGFPVLFDASHSVQEGKYSLSLARAAIAAGADGIFIEVHQRPSMALCDSETSFPLGRLKVSITSFEKIFGVVNHG